MNYTTRVHTFTTLTRRLLFMVNIVQYKTFAWEQPPHNTRSHFYHPYPPPPVHGEHCAIQDIAWEQPPHNTRSHLYHPYLPPPVHGEHCPMKGIRQGAGHELSQHNVGPLLGTGT